MRTVETKVTDGSQISRRNLLKLAAILAGGEVAATITKISRNFFWGMSAGWMLTSGKDNRIRLAAALGGGLLALGVPFPDFQFTPPANVPEVTGLPQLPEGMSFAYNTAHSELQGLPPPTLLIDAKVPTDVSSGEMARQAANQLGKLFGFEEETIAQIAREENVPLETYIQARRAPTTVKMITEKVDYGARLLQESKIAPEIQRLLDEGTIPTAVLLRQLTALREEARAAANTGLVARVNNVLEKIPVDHTPTKTNRQPGVIHHHSYTAGNWYRSRQYAVYRKTIAKASFTIILILPATDAILSSESTTADGQKLLFTIRKAREQLIANQMIRMAQKIERAFPPMLYSEEESAERQRMIELINRARAAAQKGLGGGQLTTADIADIGAAAALGTTPHLKMGDRRAANNEALALLRNLDPKAAPEMWRNFSPADRKILISDGLFEGFGGLPLLIALAPNLSDNAQQGLTYQEMHDTLLRISDKRLAAHTINSLSDEQKVRALATLTADELGNILNAVLVPYDPQPLLVPSAGDIGDPNIVASQPGKEAELLLARQLVANILTYVNGEQVPTPQGSTTVYQPKNIEPIVSALKNKISGDERKLRWFWYLANHHYHRLPKALRPAFADTIRRIQGYLSFRLVETGDSNERNNLARLLFALPASIGMSVYSGTERGINPSRTQILDGDLATYAQTAKYLEVVNSIEPVLDFSKLLSLPMLFDPAAALNATSAVFREKDRYNKEWRRATRLLDGLNSLSAETVAAVFARWFESYNQDSWRYMGWQNHPILQVMRLVNRRSLLEKREFVLNETNANIIRGFFMFLKNIPEVATADGQTWSPTVHFFRTLLDQAPLIAGATLNLGLTRWHVNLLAGTRKPIHPQTGKETAIDALTVAEKRSALEQLSQWQILFSAYRWGILNNLVDRDFSNYLNSLQIVLERLSSDKIGSVFLRHLSDVEVERQFLALSGVEHSADRDIGLRVLHRYGQGVKELLERVGWQTREVDYAIPRFLRDTLASPQNTTGTGQISIAPAGQDAELEPFDQQTNTTKGFPVSFYELITEDQRRNITFELVGVLPDGAVLVQPLFNGVNAKDRGTIDDLLTPAARSGIKPSLKEVVKALRSNQPLVLKMSLSALVARKMIEINDKNPPASVMLMGVGWLDKNQPYQFAGRKWKVLRLQRPWIGRTAQRENFWQVVMQNDKGHRQTLPLDQAIKQHDVWGL